ncbi:hypothetical protein EJB05_26041 [Eragrostis curvula]|uniref:Myb/SANT-like domain-containing protein n=1 Tax=Eragrostis curvula TaxID=38414 RepID=A0A5J9UIW5_9POAL|nr:hypothetical protein EJB05_26041 [Eragrostis curvula]
MAAEAIRANWNYVQEKGFLDILNEHKVEDRFTSQNGWTAEGWNSIHRKFNQMFPFARYTKAHLQEKNKDLKATYKAIRDARKDSGAGLDPASGMVTGGPNVWDKIEKYHKKVVKFRKKGFLHYNSCELLYEGSIATGDLSFTSTDPVHQSFENIEEEHMETARVSGAAASVGHEASVGAVPASSTSGGVVLASSTGVDVVPASSTGVGGVGAMAASYTSVGAQETSEASSAGVGAQEVREHSGKKRKPGRVAVVLDDYLEHKKVQSGKAVEAIMEKKMRAEEYSIEKCLDTTDCMEELTDEDKAIASEVFEDDKNREMFMKHKNHNVRLLWLRRKIRRLADT